MWRKGSVDHLGSFGSSRSTAWRTRLMAPIKFQTKSARFSPILDPLTCKGQCEEHEQERNTMKTDDGLILLFFCIRPCMLYIQQLQQLRRWLKKRMTMLMVHRTLVVAYNLSLPSSCTLMPFSFHSILVFSLIDI